MGKCILLIDDDADDRMLFEEALEAVAPDIQLQSLSNGKDLMASLHKEQMQLYDLVFLDINMPLINGWQILAAIKQHNLYKNIPVIMYSTTSHREDVCNAEKLGALCFFTKPNNFEELEKSLQVITIHLRENTLLSLAKSSSLFMVL